MRYIGGPEEVMTKTMRRSIVALLVGLVFAVGCSSESTSPAQPAAAPAAPQPTELAEPPATATIFGAEDTVCESVRLRNEDDDQAKATSATDCLLAEIEAGRAVTVDIASITVEGDPIYMRYVFDGETTLFVTDNRADAFGRGSVQASRCSSVQRSSWFPEGVDCMPAEHPGFPEAVG